MKTKKSFLLILGICFLFSCQENEKKQTENDAIVYYGGDILTMVGENPEYVEAVVVKDGKILFAGESSEAMETAGKGHRMIDLEGKTLMPSFIDPHSHFINSLGMSTQANCSPSPVGEADDVAGVIRDH